MKRIVILSLFILFQLLSLGQSYPISLKFRINRGEENRREEDIEEEISLDSTLIMFFVIKEDTFYCNFNENQFNIPDSVANKIADLHFIYKRYKLNFNSVMFNLTNYPKHVWTICIDKRPFDDYNLSFISKKEWWKIKWVCSLVRGNSQIVVYKFWFPFLY